jgi:hypothetical protein
MKSMDDYLNPIDKLDSMIKCNKMIQHIYSLSSLKFDTAGVIILYNIYYNIYKKFIKFIRPMKVCLYLYMLFFWLKLRDYIQILSKFNILYIINI